MAQWVKQPLRNADTIKDRHDIVECLVDASSARSELHDVYMKKMPDVMVLSKKLMRKKASLQDIFRVYQVVLRMPKLVTIMEDLGHATVGSVLVQPLRDTLGVSVLSSVEKFNNLYSGFPQKDLQLFKEMVEQVIDKDGIERGEYFVKASFDDELGELHDNMDAIKEKIQSQLRKATSDLGLDSIKLDYVSHLGYHFRIPLKDESVIRKNNKYKVLDAIKGGARFSTDRLGDLNDDFRQAKVAYEEQQQSIVDEIIRVASEWIISVEW